MPARFAPPGNGSFLFALTVLFFAGTTWLHVAMGPLEAKARAGVDRLYPKSALFSRERGELVGAWLAGEKRYDGASRVTVAVLYGMRLLIATMLTWGILRLFFH